MQGGESVSNQPLLSICIPTYNRDEIVFAGVQHALGYESDDIEIVVSDNHSSDSTERLLSMISDKRFRYYRTDENIGSANLLAVMRKACGKYALLISDEDEILYSGIAELLTILRKNVDYSLVYGSVNLYGKPYIVRNDSTFRKGYEATREIYAQGYMSGIVYNKRYLMKIIGAIPDEAINAKFGAGYNFAVVSVYMCGFDDICTTSHIVCDHVREGARDKKTYFYLGKGVLTYSPEARIDQGKFCIKAFCDLDITYIEKWKLSIESIIHSWVANGTAGYLKAIIENDLSKELREGLELSETENVLDKYPFNYMAVSRIIICSLLSKFMQETNTSKIKLVITMLTHPGISLMIARGWWYYYKWCKQLLQKSRM